MLAPSPFSHNATCDDPLLVLFTDPVDRESSAMLAAQVMRAARQHMVVCVTLADPNLPRPAEAPERRPRPLRESDRPATARRSRRYACELPRRRRAYRRYRRRSAEPASDRRVFGAETERPHLTGHTGVIGPSPGASGPSRRARWTVTWAPLARHPARVARHSENGPSRGRYWTVTSSELGRHAASSGPYCGRVAVARKLDRYTTIRRSPELIGPSHRASGPSCGRFDRHVPRWPFTPNHRHDTRGGDP
jgi:hypothetical protein